jgi:lysophospholipase L1-like esterase
VAASSPTYGRLTVGLGCGFIAIGLLVNRWTLAPLSPDGSVSGWWPNAMILLFQLAMVSYGVFAVRFRRGHIVEVCLMLTSLAVAFLFLELAWRVYLFGGATFSYDKMNSLQSLGESGMLRESRDPGVVFELRPSVDQLFKLVEFRTNSVGMRDEEYGFDKPDGVFRIAVVGDSYTMGSGVPVEHAYPSVLERLLNSRAGTTAEVLNFGVGAYTLLHYQAVMREKMLWYEPDLIVVGFCAQNDHRVPRDDILTRRFVPRERKTVFWHSHLVQFFRDLGRGGRPGVSPSEIEYLRAAFGAIAETARVARVPVIVAYLANRPSDKSTVRQLALENDLEWVNAGRAITSTGMDLRDYSTYYPMDTHPNEAAHRAFAEAIYEFIAARNAPTETRGFPTGEGSATATRGGF